MKHRIKNFVSLIIAASMLLSLIPLTSAALDDEFEGFETLEEVPFEFELEPGDLPWEQLGTATLAASDIPACISPALAEARGHVNRLYLQEPDDYTVMFQNRDGSKTIYVFSYPVKSTGMSMNTAATIQVNGSAISFASGNIITSRIGVDLFDYNIGYCEVQTFFGGLLTADGVNITEDARGWARSESSAGNLVYNMSGSAAAEYNMNMSATATAALVPGVTITPIDPTPAGGITVMAITYSELAGLMSFKSVSNNQYLTLTTSSTPSLTTSASLIVKYSQWIVQFDATFGYILANASNVPNTFIGTTSGQNVLSIGSISELSCVFGITIVSSGDSTVTIGYDNLALDPLLSIYENNPEDDAFPTACEWRIVNHHSVVLVSGINSTSSTRIEQSGVAFKFDYTFTGQNPNYYEIDLYSASTNQPFAYDSKFYEDDEYWCTTNTPGVYSVYYKDTVMGVCSEIFTLIVYNTPSFVDNYTYVIQPASNPNLYLTMEIDNNITSNDLTLSSITYEKVAYGASSGGPNLDEANFREAWENQSKTFTIKKISNHSDNYYVSATLSSSQNNDPYLTQSGSSGEFTGTYTRLTLDDDEITNTINLFINGDDNVELCTKHKDDDYSQMRIWNIGEYYYILCGTVASSENLALKYVSTSTGTYTVEVAPLDEYDPSFRWSITHVGIDIPLIKQTRNYVCGYTTLLQVLMSADLDVTVNPDYIGEDGDTVDDLDAKMKTIACIVDDLNGEAPQNHMASYANTLLGHDSIVGKDNIESVYCNALTSGDGLTDYQLSQHLLNSIETGFAPFFLTRKKYSPFKYGETGAHYVAIAGVKYSDDGNDTNDFVIVSNCHYNDNVFGVYVISFEDFRKGWLDDNNTGNTPYLYYFTYYNGGNE